MKRKNFMLFSSLFISLGVTVNASTTHPYIYESKQLSALLFEINKNSETKYFLNNSSDDLAIRMPSKKLKTFYELDTYIDENTNFDIFVTAESKFSKKQKKVSVQSKAKKENDLKLVKQTLKGKYQIGEVISRFEQITGFKVIFTDDSKMIEKFKTAMSFNSVTAEEMLISFSLKFNLFVDVNYQNKTVSFTKYKIKNIFVPTEYEAHKIKFGFKANELDQNRRLYENFKKSINETKFLIESADKKEMIKVFKNKIRAVVTQKTLNEITRQVEEYKKSLIALNISEERQVKLKNEHILEGKTLVQLLSEYRDYLENEKIPKNKETYVQMLVREILSRAKKIKNIDYHYFKEDIALKDKRAISRMISEFEK